MTTTKLSLHIFVMVLKYLYCIPLYVVEFKMQGNPESTIKSRAFYLFGLNFISYIVYLLSFFLYFYFLHIHCLSPMAFACISAVPEIKKYILIFIVVVFHRQFVCSRRSSNII